MHMKNSTNMIRIASDIKFRKVYDGTFKLLFITSILTFSIASLMNSF